MKLSLLPGLFVFASLASTAFGCASPASDDASSDSEVKSAPLEAATFVCSTDKKFGGGKAHTITFALSGLDGDTDTLAWAGDSAKADENGDFPIVASPEDSKLAFINDNYSVTFEKGNLRIFGDADGIQFTTAVLLKKTGFKTGTLEIEDTLDDANNAKSALECVVTRIEKAKAKTE